MTGFLGPNGAGKTTALRCILGLVRATSGGSTIGGVAYPDLPEPLRSVGAVLESSSFHPGRTARGHLRLMAQAGGIVPERVGGVLRLTGIEEYADRRVGGYSLGMRQRLGLAQAMLGDPGVLLLDEPANGLDPAGIAWLRTFLRGLADEGRTVLVSSHVLAEVQQTVDDVVVLTRGRVVAQGPLAELEAGRSVVRVRTPVPEPLVIAVLDEGGRMVAIEDGAWEVTGLTASQVGAAAFRVGVELHELTPVGADLERLFLDLTSPDSGQPGADVWQAPR